MKFLKK